MPRQGRAPKSCPSCGQPFFGKRCPRHAWYGNDHARRARDAIAAEPWCHTPGGCPYPDAGTDTNPLQGGHPLPVDAFNSHDEWRAQPLAPQCRRCNQGKREQRSA